MKKLGIFVSLMFFMSVMVFAQQSVNDLLTHMESLSESTLALARNYGVGIQTLQGARNVQNNLNKLKDLSLRLENAYRGQSLTDRQLQRLENVYANIKEITKRLEDVNWEKLR